MEQRKYAEFLSMIMIIEVGLTHQQPPVFHLIIMPRHEYMVWTLLPLVLVVSLGIGGLIKLEAFSCEGFNTGDHKIFFCGDFIFILFYFVLFYAFQVFDMYDPQKAEGVKYLCTCFKVRNVRSADNHNKTEIISAEGHHQQ